MAVAAGQSSWFALSQPGSVDFFTTDCQGCTFNNFGSLTLQVTLLGGPATVGEASKQSEAPDRMLASWDPVAGMIDVTYMPACGAVDHNIYFGPLSAVGTYDWSGLECSVGASGTTSFDPLFDSIFYRHRR
jgi:hypothetical protein